jgi:hypothetical protein
VAWTIATPRDDPRALLGEGAAAWQRRETNRQGPGWDARRNRLSPWPPPAGRRATARPASRASARAETAVRQTGRRCGPACLARVRSVVTELSRPISDERRWSFIDLGKRWFRAIPARECSSSNSR